MDGHRPICGYGEKGVKRHLEEEHMQTLSEAGICIVPTPIGLRYVRSQLGLTQEKLGAALKISRTGINRWERRKFEPTAANREELEHFCRQQRVDYASFQLGSVVLKIISNYDKYTSDHCFRVAMLVEKLGKKIRGIDLAALKVAAILHDTGKLFIEQELLNKAGNYDESEKALMKEHAATGGVLVALLMVKHPLAGRIVKEHHERIDGKGYYAKAGSQILLESKVLSVCDIFDACSTRRPYKAECSVEKSLAILRANAGLDQGIVNKLERIVRNTKLLDNLECDEHLYVYDDKVAFYPKQRA